MKQTDRPKALLLRIPTDLHERLLRDSSEQKRSLNQYCGELLSRTPDADPTEIEMIVKKVYGRDLIGIVLFGSTARGEDTEASDIDLLIVLRTGSDISRAQYDRWDETVTEKSHSRWTPHIVELPKNLSDVGSLWYEVALEGIVLFDRDNALNHLLQKLRNEMVTRRIERKWSHGHPYWVRHEE